MKVPWLPHIRQTKKLVAASIGPMLAWSSSPVIGTRFNSPISPRTYQRRCVEKSQRRDHFFRGTSCRRRENAYNMSSSGVPPQTKRPQTALSTPAFIREIAWYSSIFWSDSNVFQIQFYGFHYWYDPPISCSWLCDWHLDFRRSDSWTHCTERKSLLEKRWN